MNEKEIGKLAGTCYELNAKKNVDVYLCFHGNTNCICVSVEENRSLVYQNKAFANNSKGIQDMINDVTKMLEEKERQQDGKAAVL